MNILAIGDSLFAGTENNIPCTKEQQWIGLLAIENGWNLTNLGIAGQTMSFSKNLNFANNYSVKSIWQALCCEQFYEYGTPLNFKVGNPNKDNKNEVNLILLEGGPNDFGKSVSLENGDNTYNTYSCFKGAYKMVIDQLLNEYPYACIACITAWSNPSKDTIQGYTRDQYYIDSVKSLITELYNNNLRVGVIDASNPNISGIDISDRSIAYDNFHLKPSGMRIMADHMLPYIELLEANNFKFPANKQIITETI